MTAFTLVVSRHGHFAGAALVCVDARYFSVMVPGVTTLARRPVSPTEWKAIAAEMLVGIGPGPLPADSTIARVICTGDASSYQIQYIMATPVVANPERLAQELDVLLRGITA